MKRKGQTLKNKKESKILRLRSNKNRGRNKIKNFEIAALKTIFTSVQIKMTVKLL